MARKRTLDLSLLLESWELSLRAERKSAQTVKSYGDGVRAFIRWAAGAGVNFRRAPPALVA